MVMPQAFQRGWLGATQRLFHLAQAFRGLGFDVVLLAAKALSPEVQDRLDDAFPGLVIRTPHSGDYPPILDQSATSRRAVRAGWRARGNHYYWARVSWGWADRLDVQWVRTTLASLQIRPTLVWGVSAGQLEGAVGAFRLAACFNLPYVLELQDPPRGAGLEQDNPLTLKQFERQLIAAAAIVVTTVIYRDYLLQRFPLSAERVHVIHLTYQPEPGRIKTTLGTGDQAGSLTPSEQAEPAAPVADGVFRIGYAGSLYAGQTLLPVVRAFVLATEREPAMRASCRMVLVGGGPGVREALECAQALGAKLMVNYDGALPGPSVRTFLQSLQVLVVMLEEQRFRQVPGKIYESLAAQRCILGAMPVNCEAAWMLRESGLGIVHAPQDIRGMAKTLRTLWRQWRNHRLTVQPNHAFIEHFSTAHLPAKLQSVIGGLH